MSRGQSGLAKRCGAAWAAPTTKGLFSVIPLQPPRIISIHPLTPMDQIPVVSQFRGHITAPLPADSPLAYKEDVIVNLMIQILTMLISIGHIKAERLSLIHI